MHALAGRDLDGLRSSAAPGGPGQAGKLLKGGGGKKKRAAAPRLFLRSDVEARAEEVHSRPGGGAGSGGGGGEAAAHQQKAAAAWKENGFKPDARGKSHAPLIAALCSPRSLPRALSLALSLGGWSSCGWLVSGWLSRRREDAQVEADE